MNRFIRPPKWRKVTQRKPCIFQPRFTLLFKNLLLRPRKGFIDARHLCGEGLTTIEQSHYSYATMPNRCSVGRRSHDPWGIHFQAKKLLKGFHKTFSPRRAFLGNENDDYALTSSHVNLEPRVSRRLTKRKCSPPNCWAGAQWKPLSEVLMILQESHIHVAENPCSR